ncbi:MAG: chromate transporter, partial [Chloroflexi bacterium]|nr:chromate transporter [Chloroflexota bacterium]
MRRFLQGVNIAVIASLVHAAIALGSSALIDPIALLLCAAAFGALWWKKIDAHWLVGVGVLVGLSRLAIF